MQNLQKHRHYKVVRHVSISFKDLLTSSSTTSNTLSSLSNTPEKQPRNSNCHSNSRILNLSLYHVLKENQAPRLDSAKNHERRIRIKQLSVNFKLNKETMSIIN